MNWMEQEELTFQTTAVFLKDRLYDFHQGAELCFQRCYTPVLLQSPAEDDLLSHDPKERAKAERARECVDVCSKQFGKTYAKAKSKFEAFVNAHPDLKKELVGEPPASLAAPTP
eukprot:GGOE01036260.1.p1 GENE.GGOE01036260.1~~GGOE01036260.1.p1  ORF type:complete len:114 (-),score=37.68 GGOE01036260.1:273-614(-)